MTDTQWPNYLVFEKKKSGGKFQHAGSVHAADDEFAIMYARDTFVRRPDCFGLKVVLNEKLYSKTKEEIEEIAWDEKDTQSPKENFYVFHKLEPRGSCIYSCEVESHDHQQALEIALRDFPNDKAMMWWVIAAKDFIANEEEDSDMMFTPAKDKIYRNQKHYHTVALMKKIKEQQQ